jgi:Nucleotidyltransferase domain
VTKVDIPELLDTFGVSIRAQVGAVALYVGGSLATGDYRPGVSDLDLAVVIERPLDEDRQQKVVAIHHRLIASGATDEKLHCVYIPADDVADVRSEHLTWASEELFRRPFSGIARAELLAHGYAVFGPPPDALIPAISDDELAEAVRGALTGYWTTALSHRRIWLQDIYVDLGLTTLARAEATLTGHGLITKTEAISRLDRFGVPAELIEEMKRRRDGEVVVISPGYRLRRAILVRRLVTDGIKTVLAD